MALASAGFRRCASPPRAVITLLIAASAAPAPAQVAGSLAIESDYRSRGYSHSDGRPTAIGQLSYDDPSGFYLDALAAAAWKGGDPKLVAITGSGGYARRLAGGFSADAGVLRSEYPDQRGSYGANHYTEFYLGLLGHNLASHVYFSPDYLAHGVRTLYAEMEATIALAAKLRLNAHAGRLTYLGKAGSQVQHRDQYDWRLTVSRRFSVFDLHASLSGGGPGKDYYDHRVHSKTVLTGGVSWTF